MMQADEDALVCDFAETYHILDYKRLPATLAASLAVGLRDNSRIKSKLSGQQISPEIILMTCILDQLNVLTWLNTVDATKGRNRPKPLLDILMPREKQSDLHAFDSGKDFDLARKKLIQATLKGGD